MSAPTPVFTARFENGRLKFDRREAFLGYMQGLEGQPLDVRVSKRRKDRSAEANRYYWGVCVATYSEFSGMTPDEVHEAFKIELLIDRTTGEVGSTSSLNKQKFSEYVDGCIRICAEMGCVIPDASNY